MRLVRVVHVPTPTWAVSHLCPPTLLHQRRLPSLRRSPTFFLRPWMFPSVPCYLDWRQRQSLPAAMMEVLCCFNSSFSPISTAQPVSTGESHPHMLTGLDHYRGKRKKKNTIYLSFSDERGDGWVCGRVTNHLCVFCECVLMTHAGAQAAWQARLPFGWPASRREHGRGRKWSLAAGSRKDWKSSSPAMNRHRERDTKHGSQSSERHTGPEPKEPPSPRLATATSSTQREMRCW